MAFGNIGQLYQIATQSITPTDAFTPFAKNYQLYSQVADKRQQELLRQEGLLGIQELQQEAQSLDPNAPNYTQKLSGLMMNNADLFTNPYSRQAAQGIFSVLEDAGRLQAQDQRSTAYQNYLNQKLQQNNSPLSPSSNNGGSIPFPSDIDGGLALPEGGFEAPILTRQQQRELDNLIDKKNKVDRELEILLENSNQETDTVKKKQLDDRARLKIGEGDDLLNRINRFGYNEPLTKERFPRSNTTAQGLYGAEFNRSGKPPTFKSVTPRTTQPTGVMVGGINLGNYTGSLSNPVPPSVSAPVQQPAQTKPKLVIQDGVLYRFDPNINDYVPAN